MFQFTLPRGERHAHDRDLYQTLSFNSRSRVGSDDLRRRHALLVIVSIHAPAWGATPLPAIPSATRSFQFTLPRGERLGALELAFIVAGVSIHAPAWGATHRPRQRGLRLSVSIHAPAWGATTVANLATIIEAVSIHAPAWGATGVPCKPPRYFDVSIHAPAWGATSRDV